MNKEEILAKSRKENVLQDEMERTVRIEGESFSLILVFLGGGSDRDLQPAPRPACQQCAGHVLGLLCGQPPLPFDQAEEHLRRGDAADLSCFFGLESGKILHTGMVRTWMNSWS